MIKDGKKPNNEESCVPIPCNCHHPHYKNFHSIEDLVNDYIQCVFGNKAKLVEGDMYIVKHCKLVKINAEDVNKVTFSVKLDWTSAKFTILNNSFIQLSKLNTIHVYKTEKGKTTEISPLEVKLDGITTTQTFAVSPTAEGIQKHVVKVKCSEAITMDAEFLVEARYPSSIFVSNDLITDVDIVSCIKNGRSYSDNAECYTGATCDPLPGEVTLTLTDKLDTIFFAAPSDYVNDIIYPQRIKNKGSMYSFSCGFEKMKSIDVNIDGTNVSYDVYKTTAQNPMVETIKYI